MDHDRLARIISGARGKDGRWHLGAVDRGAVQVSTNVWEWDVAGKCLSPVWRELYSRPSASDKDPAREFVKAARAAFPGARKVSGFDRRPTRARYIRVHSGPRVPQHLRTPVPLRLKMRVRCRQCEHCLRVRAMDWEFRARTETEEAVRTWFGSMTLRPEAHVVIEARAVARLAKGGTDFWKLSSVEQFQERIISAGPEVTKFLKRIRKECGSYRYLWVVEAHKSGLPHYHCLIHELCEGSHKKEVLDRQWKLGFCKFKLVDELEIKSKYICKYLAKSAAARVRASQAYGHNFSLEKFDRMPPAIALMGVKNDYTPKHFLPEQSGGIRREVPEAVERVADKRRAELDGTDVSRSV